jgi:hypothetical protein
MRDTEKDQIEGMVTLAAAVFTGYVSHTLYAASSWLPEGLYKDTFTLSAAVAIVAGGLALRGAYLLAYFVHGVRADLRRDRARRR